MSPRQLTSATPSCIARAYANERIPAALKTGRDNFYARHTLIPTAVILCSPPI
jgi:hypothetical protein